MKAKNEYKKEDGFKSIFSQFNNNQQEFEKFAVVGVLNAGGTDIYQSQRGGHASRKTLEINGKPIKPKQVVNWKEALAAIRRQNHSGKADGTMLFVYKSGQKTNGDPVYTAKLVINNHEDLQEKAEKNYSILYELARRIENGDKELRAIFKEQFAISLGWSNLDEIMDYYMNLRMDYRFVHKHVSEGKTAGGIQAFYKQFFINSPFPLTIVKNIKSLQVNANYYDDIALFEAVKQFMKSIVNQYVDMDFETDEVYVLGKKNAKFIQKLNAEEQWFDRLVVLDHPRYIQQYKFKEREAYINQYLNVLKF